MSFITEYIHQPFPDLKVSNQNGMRFYEAPNGLHYPSITTVLGKQPGKQKGLQEWRKRVGEKEANKISTRALRQGTNVHNMIEEFLNNDQPDFTNPVGVDLFRSIKPELIQRINNIHAQEVSLYSKHLGLAGRVDCIAEYNGRLSVIDFKTSRRPKKKEWIKDYFLQACAYSIMWEERTEIPIGQLVIMISVEDSDPEIYVERRDNWDKELCSVIREYYEYNSLEIPKGWGLLRK